MRPSDVNAIGGGSLGDVRAFFAPRVRTVDGKLIPMAIIDDATFPHESRLGPDERINKVLELVRERGGRVTSSRRQLLRCLFDNSSHRTAEELANELHEISPDVHLSTVYRNLDDLERLGVIVHAHLGHGPATYHLSSQTHGHLVCEHCGVTLEAPHELFDGLVSEAQRTLGFEVDARHFAVLGRCSTCSTCSTSRVND